jgi:Holliday junction resolvase RusA-like endonuclease
LIRFDVSGLPRTEGNLVCIGRHARGSGARLIHRHGGELEAWRESIGWVARASGAEMIPAPRPVMLTVTFRMKPPARFPAGRSRWWAATIPDLDKLTRACFDALKGIAYSDDGQVTKLEAEKRYARPTEEPGVEIAVWELAMDASEAA